ncbi:circadian clock protein KaiB [Nakamurella sp. UYEF19]|uniref:circadian clock KaiB family protein n=1 Tax=Nakamurella sp. UYEF19 TaxID=1756392 RepID=UPI0033913FEC
MTGEHDAALARYEQQLVAAAVAEYVFTLFVSGASEMSAVAIGNARSFCERHLAGRYRLQVVDVHRDLATMMAADVLAAPTLLREAPLPRRKLVGDLSDTARVLAALNIHESSGPIAS